MALEAFKELFVKEKLVFVANLDMIRYNIFAHRYCGNSITGHLKITGFSCYKREPAFVKANRLEGVDYMSKTFTRVALAVLISLAVIVGIYTSVSGASATASEDRAGNHLVVCHG